MTTRRIHHGRFWLILGLAIFWAIVLTVAARAQSTGNVRSARQESTPSAVYLDMYNASSGDLAQGTIVMIDTVAAVVGHQTSFGKGFVVWDGNPANMWRVCGVLIDDAGSYEYGRVLARGTYNYALIDSGGHSALTRLRPSFVTAGAFGRYMPGDSATVNKAVIPVGALQRYLNTTSVRAFIWVDFLGLTSRVR